MATNNKKNRVTVQARNLALISGLTQREADLRSFLVAGATVATADVIRALQTENAAMNAVLQTKAAWQASVQAAKAAEAKNHVPLAGVVQSLKTMFAGQVDLLADFGLTVRKVAAPLTPEKKAASAAKSKATRAARRTMGSVQKKAVKGNVTGVVVTKVTAPTAGAGTPAPHAT